MAISNVSRFTYCSFFHNLCHLEYMIYMNLQRILTIINKEWAEVFKNRLVLFTVAFLPLLFTVLPLGVLYGTHTGGSTAGDLPPQFQKLCGNLATGECLQFFVLNEFLILFMLMPLLIPISIA